MHKVFVYGTLKSGHGNHNHCMPDAKFIEKGRLSDHIMYDLGCFPGIVPKEGYAVYGEVYEITDKELHRVDCLEGYYGNPHDLYSRTQEKITLKGGSEIEAYVYIFNRSLEGCEVVKNGWWKQ